MDTNRDRDKHCKIMLPSQSGEDGRKQVAQNSIEKHTKKRIPIHIHNGDARHKIQV